jgi:hypothetical protein
MLAWEPVPVSAPPAPAAPLALHALPNPFNPKTTLRFTLPEAGRATLTVHDASGRLVATPADGRFEAGAHAVVWAPGAGTPSGLYLATLRAGGAAASEKLVLLK